MHGWHFVAADVGVDLLMPVMWCHFTHKEQSTGKDRILACSKEVPIGTFDMA